MPRNAGVTVENNFSKGLVTEATGLNFPENAVTDGENCVFARTGSVSRRLGVDYENGFTVRTRSSLTSSAGIINEFQWTTVNNDSSISFLVQQLGNRIRLFQIDENPLSGNLESFNITLSAAVAASSTQIAQSFCSFSQGAGYLFVTHPYCDPFYVEYNSSTNTITTTDINLQIRDFEGVDDGTTIDSQTITTLDTAHRYNLLNQGWFPTSVITATETLANPITYFNTHASRYPNNAEVWWVWKDATGRLDLQGSTNSNMFKSVFLGNTAAAKGHYIIDLFLTNRDTVSGLTGLTIRTAGNARPSVTAFWTGRVWYAGTNASTYANEVYFSKIIETVEDFGVCYQAADPTIEDSTGIVASDGGVIKIPEIENVVALKVVGSFLVIFATNGIWTISGGDSGPFKADNFIVAKISSVPAISETSIVNVNGFPMWWNFGGIYGMSVDQVGQGIVVNDLGATSIQAEIDGIPSGNKFYIKGAYNPVAKVTQFLARRSNSSSFTNNFEYDTIYVVDNISGAFYKHTIDITSTPKLSGVICIQSTGTDTVAEDVTDSSVTVTDSAVTVTSQVLVEIPNFYLFKYVITGNISSGSAGHTFGELNNTTYLDWRTFDSTGVNFSSYFLTGYMVRGQGILKQQSNYVNVFTEPSADDSCFMQGVWDYHGSPAGGKWTNQQQVTKDVTSEQFAFRRLKVRGRGTALQLRFFSEEGKPFTIIGWSMVDHVNAGP